MTPIFVVRDMAEALAFYTGRLDFVRDFGWPEEDAFYVGLRRGADELHLTLPHRPGRSSAILLCEDVDAAWTRFLGRGLVAPTRENSPVHAAPLDQSWGTREVYVDDPSGNTLIFQQR